jgi:Ser/Thr protein kinase RdoA (MazF antagonist)
MVLASRTKSIEQRNNLSYLMRDSFPAVYSTLSPQALIELVLARYDLGDVDRCLLWNRGLSDIYLVECDTCSYILRITHHHWRSRLEVDFELELLNFLHERQLPVAYPIPTIEGNLFVTISALEGDRYAALFPYAEGAIPLGDLDLIQSQIMGEILGRLHHTGQDFTYQATPKTLNLDYLLDNSLKEIAPFWSEDCQELDYLKYKADKIKSKLADLPKKAPYWGICWGDPHSGNAHFTQDNKITIFDFDQCGYSWRAFDVAKFLQVSLNAGMSRKVRDAFFEGYQTIQSLTDVERDCLQALTQTAHLWQWAISIEDAAVHCWSRLDRSYFKKRLEQLKCLDSSSWQLF